MKHRTLSLLLMTLLAVAVASSAQSTTSAIEGTVKRADSGDPIKGAVVSLSGGPPVHTRKILECMGLPSHSPPIARAVSNFTFE